MGLEIKRLELARGPLKPRLAPRTPQTPPRLRPDRQARTPRTGKWGFGLTPAYQGRRTAHPEKIRDAEEWTASTLAEIALPALVTVPKGELLPPSAFSLGFAPKGSAKGKHSRKKRATQLQMSEWAHEQARKNAAEKKREEDE